MGNEQSSVSPLYKSLDDAMPPLGEYVWDSKTWNYVSSGSIKGVFTGARDRETFLIALSTVLASASEPLLEDMNNVTFKLLISRRADATTSESLSPHASAPSRTARPDSAAAENRPADGATTPRAQPSGTASSTSAASWWKRQFSIADANEQEEIMASLVILDVRTGRLIAKMQPQLYGRTQLEAFQHFRKDVERRLERVLARTASAFPDDDARPQSPGLTELSSPATSITMRSNGSSPATSIAYEVPVGELFDVAPPSYEKSTTPNR